MNLNTIRNFSIIAHIDHGKSTLADRMLELTSTIEKRKMREQFLDSMELERERGITIKMKPVRMRYTYHDTSYVLNLIDTPGHIDFSYEVSRALKAVEGVVLLVDATQGVQAQTLTTLYMAQEAGLRVIPVISKIDMAIARVEETKHEIVKLLSCVESDILLVSGKTGEGVEALLQAVITRIPPPATEFEGKGFRGLIFDFHYSTHTGVTVYLRVFDGGVSAREDLAFVASGARFAPLEVGVFSPGETPQERLSAGEIGYLVTGIKEPGIASVGDTITVFRSALPALPGYMQPRPVVWASMYPESQDDLDVFRQALGRLRLSDSSFSYEEESSGVLGRGFRLGFLGMLHLEIIAERLKREHNLTLVITTPSVTYQVIDKRGQHITAYSPVQFPDFGMVVAVEEPWVDVKIITPPDYVSPIMQLLYDHEAEVISTENFGEHRTSIELSMPLRELMRNFFDEIKSATSGFASMSYKIGALRPADVVKLEILVADEPVAAFARIVSRRRVETEAEKAVEKLASVLSRQLFETKIQAKALGRIIASRRLAAMRKDVTGYLYGGDITRKKKLWEKQKKGKKKLKENARVSIPHEVFLKMVQRE